MVRNKLNRFAVALGGFLIFIGIIFTSIFLIDFLEIFEIDLFQPEIQGFFLLLLISIAALDLISGIILLKK